MAGLGTNLKKSQKIATGTESSKVNWDTDWLRQGPRPLSGGQRELWGTTGTPLQMVLKFPTSTCCPGVCLVSTCHFLQMGASRTEPLWEVTRLRAAGWGFEGSS